MKVLKFGGSSLADANRFDKVARIISSSVVESATATVVSAPQTVTNRLVALTEAISTGSATQHIAPIEAHLSGILQASYELYPRIDQNHCQQVFKELIDKLHQLTKGAELLGHCPDQTYAEIVVTGERFSILVLSAILKTRFKQVDILEPQRFITIKEGSSDPVVNLEKTLELYKENYQPEASVLLMPGFSASDHEGRPTTLGRNGSDYSAAILAVCVNAEVCEVWTDVDGVYNSDPNLITDAQLLDTMSYHEAMELSYFGAKILHPKTITPLRQYQIPCRIKNTHSPENSGTLISSESVTQDNIRAVTNMPDVALFTVSGPEMKSMAGIASRIFSTIKEVSLSVIMVSQSSAEHSISFCVPGKEAKMAHNCLNVAFQLELQSGLLNPIKLQTQLAMITIVGDRMQNQRGIAAKFFTALAKARVNIIAIAQDSSERSISAVVRAKRLDDATKICHRSLFKHHATIDAIVIGCGTVGSVLIEQIQNQSARLLKQNIALNLIGIANSKKVLLNRNGIKDKNWRDLLPDAEHSYSLETLVEFSHDAHLLNPVVIDCTSSPEVSRQYVEYLQRGFHVVTANKKANTDDMDYYQALRHAAKAQHKKFLYETNVGAGLPIIDNLQGLLKAGDELQTFFGILSGSLSFIFGEVHNGLSLSEATLKARELGYTEPNPAEDLNGLDVARKALVIAREAGLHLELEDIKVEPAVPDELAKLDNPDEFITRLKDYDVEFDKVVKAAEADDKVLRYIAEIEGDSIHVGIQAVAKDHPLYPIQAGENAMVVHTSFYNPVPVVIRGYGAGADVTAAGLFGDLIKTMSVETSV